MKLSRTSSEDTAAQERDTEKGDAEGEVQNFTSKPGTKVERVDAELLEVGDVVRVLHGASPPADGIIVSGGGAAFDESSLTGESRLVKKQVGEKVFVGTINKAGVVDVRVDEIGGRTMLDHVMKVVREGQAKRAPIERLVDIITGYFVPVVTLLAIATWVIWLGLGFGGALPQEYLDIEVGGWGECLHAHYHTHILTSRCDSGLVSGVRHRGLRRRLPMRHRARRPDRFACRIRPCCQVRYPCAWRR